MMTMQMSQLAYANKTTKRAETRELRAPLRWEGWWSLLPSPSALLSANCAMETSQSASRIKTTRLDEVPHGSSFTLSSQMVPPCREEKDKNSSRRVVRSVDGDSLSERQVARMPQTSSGEVTAAGAGEDDERGILSASTTSTPATEGADSLLCTMSVVDLLKWTENIQRAMHVSLADIQRIITLLSGVVRNESSKQQATPGAAAAPFPGTTDNREVVVTVTSPSPPEADAARYPVVDVKPSPAIHVNQPHNGCQPSSSSRSGGGTSPNQPQNLWTSQQQRNSFLSLPLVPVSSLCPPALASHIFAAPRNKQFEELPIAPQPLPTPFRRANLPDPQAAALATGPTAALPSVSHLQQHRGNVTTCTAAHTTVAQSSEFNAPRTPAFSGAKFAPASFMEQQQRKQPNSTGATSPATAALMASSQTTGPMYYPLKPAPSVSTTGALTPLAMQQSVSSSGRGGTSAFLRPPSSIKVEHPAAIAAAVAARSENLGALSTAELNLAASTAAAAARFEGRGCGGGSNDAFGDRGTGGGSPTVRREGHCSAVTQDTKAKRRRAVAGGGGESEGEEATAGDGRVAEGVIGGGLCDCPPMDGTAGEPLGNSVSRGGVNCYGNGDMGGDPQADDVNEWLRVLLQVWAAPPAPQEENKNSPSQHQPAPLVDNASGGFPTREDLLELLGVQQQQQQSAPRPVPGTQMAAATAEPQEAALTFPLTTTEVVQEQQQATTSADGRPFRFAKQFANVVSPNGEGSTKSGDDADEEFVPSPAAASTMAVSGGAASAGGGDVKGVNYIAASKTWRASFYLDGKLKSKSFSVRKYGYEGARQLAVLCRLSMDNPTRQGLDAAAAKLRSFSLRHRRLAARGGNGGQDSLNTAFQEFDVIGGGGWTPTQTALSGAEGTPPGHGVSAVESGDEGGRVKCEAAVEAEIEEWAVRGGNGLRRKSARANAFCRVKAEDKLRCGNGADRGKEVKVRRRSRVRRSRRATAAWGGSHSGAELDDDERLVKAEYNNDEDDDDDDDDVGCEDVVMPGAGNEGGGNVPSTGDGQHLKCAVAENNDFVGGSSWGDSDRYIDGVTKMNRQLTTHEGRSDDGGESDFSLAAANIGDTTADINKPADASGEEGGAIGKRRSL